MTESVRNTYSVCPVCLRRLPAAIVKRRRDYFLEKVCPEHGGFSTVVWRGDHPRFELWGDYTPPVESEDMRPDCPNDCGLCPGHLQKTCCVVVEVTERCNVACPFCFARSKQASEDPPVAQLAEWFRRLVEGGNTFVQLSGGEPTVREDLPEIIAAAQAAGCENIQLNTNGVRIAEEGNYMKALADAGLSNVFLQFDGTDDGIYEKLRGRRLFAEKKAAIEACSVARVGVTLVPTVVPGVNDQNIGDMTDFGFLHSPAVRGIHFQPVSYFGRCPQPHGDQDRITLPEVLQALERQTGGKVRISDFAPSGCEHPRCGFHADFLVMPEAVVRMTPRTETCSCSRDDGKAHLRKRSHIARRWRRTDPGGTEECPPGGGCPDMDAFLHRIQSRAFTLTAMAFQDAYTMDIERLRRCSLHVYRNGRTIPFCARYLTPAIP